MSVNSKMTALADEIRELSGTTTVKSIDAMTLDVENANIEISEQTNLLEQIATALEGKAGGGGGSGNVETCTITIVEDGPAATFIGQLFYTASDGSIVSQSNINAGESLVVIKNTMVTTSASLLGSAVLIGNFYGNVYQITGDCTIKANM